eukprot:1160381-Pelagomonas_calceolata.AAC.6
MGAGSTCSSRASAQMRRCSTPTTGQKCGTGTHGSCWPPLMDRIDTANDVWKGWKKTRLLGQRGNRAIH